MIKQDSNSRIDLQAGTFERIINQLENFSVQSEDHFLLISEKLQGFHSSSKQILQSALEVTNLLTSKQYSSGITNLKTVLSEVFSFLSETENKFSTSSGSFNNIQEILDVIDGEVFQFKKLVRHLEVQAISVKIESSRLGNDDRGFGNLALNINNLANLITNQFVGFREKVKILTDVIKKAQKQITNLSVNQHKYSDEVLKNTKSSIDSLLEKYELSSKKADSIHSGTEKIHQKISSMVTAVQFQDITRQQIEHVINVLRDVIKKFNAGENDQEVLPYTYKISQLQAAQLNNSRSELINALNEITSDLEGILGNVSGISEEILQLMANTGSGYDTFIEKISVGLNNVINTLTKNSEAENELSNSVEKVVITIGELSGFINEISNIGSEIELISLNASVKAAHTGREGAALGILAEAIQKLSIEAKKQTGSVIEKLVFVKDMSANLHNSNSENTIKNNEEKFKSVYAEINEVNNFLNSTVSKAVKDLNKIQKTVLKMEREMESTISSNRNYQDIESNLGGIITELNDIASEIEKSVDISSIEDIKLNKISKKYTMKVQRDIHESIVNENRNINDPDIFKESHSSSSHFDDNVELF